MGLVDQCPGGGGIEGCLSERVTAPPILDDQLCFALYSASLALTKAYRPILEALDLTYPQYLVMLCLWERDGLAVREIGERLRLDSGTLTPLLKRLESRGLLRRSRDAGDERRVLIALTDAGRALGARAAAIPPRVLEATGLTPQEAREERLRLAALRDRLQAWLGDG
jgi:DNA-binding MarR family transcriptional regulator